MHVVPTMSADCGFLGDEESTMPILVTRQHGTKWTNVNAVPCKGANKYAIQTQVDLVKQLGRRKFIYKSDQEPALVELKQKVMERLGKEYEIHEEHPAVVVKQSNGVIEHGWSGKNSQVCRGGGI